MSCPISLGENMALSLAVTPIGPSAGSTDSGSFILRGYLTASGSYSTGGDTLDLTALSLPPGLTLPVSTPPIGGWVQGSTGDSYSFIPGTAMNNSKIKINTASNTELAASAYPARITGDTNIYVELEFASLK